MNVDLDLVKDLTRLTAKPAPDGLHLRLSLLSGPHIGRDLRSLMHVNGRCVNVTTREREGDKLGIEKRKCADSDIPVP